MELKDFLWSLIIIYAFARVMAELAARLGQSAVLGELLAGVALGGSVLNLVQATDTLKLLGEVGIILLLFEIGLESDLQSFLKVGWSAAAVALLGVVTPFLLGYALALALHMTQFQAVFIGVALTPTSVAIPVRVLHDLGRLATTEGNIILGAAVLDDILALVGLSVIVGMAESGIVSWFEVGRTAGLASRQQNEHPRRPRHCGDDLRSAAELFCRRSRSRAARRSLGGWACAGQDRTPRPY
ncbi:MAG: hypothetical protein AUI96_03630 [Nitrospirae bacterium 13_1_40CM_3_62_11]|nr:MAG: hypothetical protein AUI96_03630 [Nitrospirae bacterium 13_1_40CM_3_62_11]